MGSYLRFALQALVKLQPAANYSSYFCGFLKAGTKIVSNAGSNKDLKLKFVEAFAASKAQITEAMKVYLTGHPVKFYHVRNETDDGRLIPMAHVPMHGDINAMARVIVLMSEPTVQCCITFATFTTCSFTCYRRKTCGELLPMKIGQGLPSTIRRLQEYQRMKLLSWRC